MRRFGYLHDRLFWVSLATYVFNRLIVRPHLGHFFQAHLHWVWPFLHSHLDDLLLMPAALPVALWIQRLAGLRKNDRPPGGGEIFLHFAVWSVMCKVVGPLFLNVGAADPWDVLFFALGGLGAGLWWNRRALAPSPSRHEL